MGCGASKDAPHDPNSGGSSSKAKGNASAANDTNTANNGGGAERGGSGSRGGGDKWAALDDIIPWQLTEEALGARQRLWSLFDVNQQNNLTKENCLAGCRNELQLHTLFPTELPIANNAAWESTHLLREKPDATVNVDPQEWRLYLRFLRDDIQLAAVFLSIEGTTLAVDGFVSKKQFYRAQDTLNAWGAYIVDPEMAWAEMDVDQVGPEALTSVHFVIVSDWLVKNRLDRENMIAAQLLEQQQQQQQQQYYNQGQEHQQDHQPHQEGGEEAHDQQHQHQQQHHVNENDNVAAHHVAPAAVVVQPHHDAAAPIATPATAEEEKVVPSAAERSTNAGSSEAPAPAPEMPAHAPPPQPQAPVEPKKVEEEKAHAPQPETAPTASAVTNGAEAPHPSAAHTAHDNDAAEIQKAAAFSAKEMTEEEKAQYLSEVEHRRSAWAIIAPQIPRQKTKTQNEARNALFKLFDPTEVGSINFAQAVKGSDEHLGLAKFDPKLDTMKIYRRAFGHAANARANLANGTKQLTFDEATATIERNEFRLFLVYIYNYLELCVSLDALQIHPQAAISFSTFSGQLVPFMVESWGIEPLVPSPKEVFDAELDHAYSLGMITFDMFSIWAIEKQIEAQNLAAEQKKKSKKAAGEGGAADEASAAQE